MTIRVVQEQPQARLQVGQAPQDVRLVQVVSEDVELELVVGDGLVEELEDQAPRIEPEPLVLRLVRRGVEVDRRRTRLEGRVVEARRVGL